MTETRLIEIFSETMPIEDVRVLSPCEGRIVVHVERVSSVTEAQLATAGRELGAGLRLSVTAGPLVPAAWLGASGRGVPLYLVPDAVLEDFAVWLDRQEAGGALPLVARRWQRIAAAETRRRREDGPAIGLTWQWPGLSVERADLGPFDGPEMLAEQMHAVMDEHSYQHGGMVPGCEICGMRRAWHEMRATRRRVADARDREFEGDLERSISRAINDAVQADLPRLLGTPVCACGVRPAASQTPRWLCPVHGVTTRAQLLGRVP